MRCNHMGLSLKNQFAAYILNLWSIVFLHANVIFVCLLPILHQQHKVLKKTNMLCLSEYFLKPGVYIDAYFIAFLFIQLFLYLLQSTKMYICTQCCGDCGQFCQKMPQCKHLPNSCTKLHLAWLCAEYSFCKKCALVSGKTFFLTQCCFVTMPLLYHKFCLIVVDASVTTTCFQCYVMCNADWKKNSVYSFFTVAYACVQPRLSYYK